MESLVAALTVFVLAIFIGFEIITKVPPTLHTPLMSGSNAISGIALVGAIISTRTDNPKIATILGVCAVAWVVRGSRICGCPSCTPRGMGWLQSSSPLMLNPTAVILRVGD